MPKINKKDEKIEQLQAQLDCMNKNYMELNKLYMVMSIAYHEACDVIKELMDENDIREYFKKRAERLFDGDIDE